MRNANGLGKLLPPEAVARLATRIPHYRIPRYSTVTDFARFLGWSTFSPRFAAM
jgi:hypothetical protein